METNQTPTSLNVFERFNQWIEESISVKLFSIGFLVIILLIPSSWIVDLMEEREGRASSVMEEVADKWSHSQRLSGPVLVIPYKVIDKLTQNNKEVVLKERIEKYFFLPEKLEVNGVLDPKILQRGIFDAVVYNASLTINAAFNKPDFKTLGIADEMILWQQAHMIFSISDLRGISENPVFKVGALPKETEPSSDLGMIIETIDHKTPAYGETVAVENTSHTAKGIIAKLNWQSAQDFQGNTLVNLNLKGSKSLRFLPTGKTTLVSLNSNWTSPGFDGQFIPENRNIDEKGFTANWKVLNYNRAFAQQWTGKNQSIDGSDFGVNLLLPVDQYQKSMRTAKYGQLIIILTFMALFLVEITKRIKIHPFQYILIGAALIIYYSLLLSLSEQLGYDLAYIVASLATVILISFYSASFLNSTRLVVLLTALLVVFYTFIFVIILQQDFSLLLGSIGLFFIVAALMFFSRKISWYKSSAIH
ncbi:MAG: cell envelope integrity protein CreD [Cytophagia bacterium]|nr:cell envelope integrity protein CreD [Cytophagia bacterium]